MKELLSALKPVRRRLRRNRWLQGAATGLCAGTAAAALLLLVSLVVPLPHKALWAAAAAAGLTVLCAAGNALRRIPPETAARAADACGLGERAVTALETADEGPMALLQRTDACAHLRAFQVKKLAPGSVKKRLLAALGCAAAAGLLLLPHTPADDAALEKQWLRRQLTQGLEQVEEAARQEEDCLTEAEKTELRRLTGDLRREAAASRDRADALLSLDRAEKRLEALRRSTAGEAAEAMAQALSQAGLDQLSAALNGQSAENASGENTLSAALEAALADQGAEKLARSLSAAAQALAGEAQRQALAASSALQAGDVQAAAQALQNAADAGSLSRLGAALQAMKSGLAGNQAGSAGDQTGSTGNQAGSTGSQAGGAGGPNGTQSGGGAGQGTTQLDAGKSPSSGAGSVRGSQDPSYREGAYETIYDPERTDAALQETQTNQNRLGEDSDRLEMGPGRGSLAGDVPYGTVVGEYAESAARAADSENLTGQERQWVTDYFTLLTDQQ